MRPFFTLLALVVASFGWAQNALSGMKDDVITAPTTQASGGGSVMPLVHLFLVIGVLFVLIKFALPKVLLKMTNKLTPSLGSSIRVEESASIGTGGAYVIQVRGRTLLVGASSTGGLTLLCDLTEEAQREAEVPAFFEVLDQAVETIDEPKQETEPAVSDRLERLLRGVGR